MKKVINIPLINIDVDIHYGDTGWKSYANYFKRRGKDMNAAVIPTHIDGQAWGSIVWLKTTASRNLLFHELQHVLDNVFREVDIKGESEFKAMISGHLLDEAMKWWETLE